MTFHREHVSARVVFISFTLLLSACTTLPPADPQHVGTVATFSGMPSVIRNGKTYLLAGQSRIYPGDILETNETSRININMIDDTQIILGNDSYFVFHEYKYEPGSFFPRAQMTFTAGTLRARTGNVTQAWFGTFEIRTPLATIKPKNADFWIELITPDNTLNVAMVAGGETYVTNDHGNVRIKQNNVGTYVLAGSAPRTPTRWSERQMQAIQDATVSRDSRQ